MIRMETGHSVDDSFSRQFLSIYIVRELSPDEIGSRSRGSRFLKKKRPLAGKFLKFRSAHHVADVGLVCKFREICPTGNRKRPALFT